MGATTSKTVQDRQFWASTPQKLTRRELLNLTQSPRLFVNQLFEVMLSKLTPKDLLDLGNRAQCKAYVFVMADAIAKTFEAIKVVPTKDEKTGVLFYRKASELTSGQGAQQTYEHCLSLSYFYVRIFQIFGALALTILDDPSAGQVLGYLQQQQQRPTGPQRPIFRAQESVPFTPQRGGSVDSGSDEYRRLQQRKLEFLSNTISMNQRNTSAILFTFDNNSDLSIRLEIANSSSVKLLLKVDSDEIIVCSLSASNTTSDTNYFSTGSKKGVSLNNFEILKKVNNETKSIGRISKQISLSLEKIDDSWYAKRKDSSKDESRFISDKIVEILQGLRDELNSKKNATVNAQGRPTTRTNAVIGQYDVGVKDGLYTGFMIKILQGKEKANVPFCVARALQLIDANSMDLMGAPQIKSHICETNFEPGPKSGSSLSQNPGLLAINQLFYTDFHVNKKSNTDYEFDLKPSDGVPGEYVEFLTALRDNFTKEQKPISMGTKLSDLKFADPNCDPSLKGSAVGITDQNVINQMRQVVNELFKLQLNHTKEVIKLMENELIEIKNETVGGMKQVRIKIHPNLTKGGVLQINKLAYKARQLLVHYYTKCEQVYQVGLRTALPTARKL
jgi:hypothetical protein